MEIQETEYETNYKDGKGGKTQVEVDISGKIQSGSKIKPEPEIALKSLNSLTTDVIHHLVLAKPFFPKEFVIYVSNFSTNLFHIA